MWFNGAYNGRITYSVLKMSQRIESSRQHLWCKVIKSNHLRSAGQLLMTHLITLINYWVLNGSCPCLNTCFWQKRSSLLNVWVLFFSLAPAWPNADQCYCSCHSGWILAELGRAATSHFFFFDLVFLWTRLLFFPWFFFLFFFPSTGFAISPVKSLAAGFILFPFFSSPAAGSWETLSFFTERLIRTLRPLSSELLSSRASVTESVFCQNRNQAYCRVTQHRNGPFNPIHPRQPRCPSVLKKWWLAMSQFSNPIKWKSGFYFENWFNIALFT